MFRVVKRAAYSGSSSAHLVVGDTFTEKYATPHPACAFASIAANDKAQACYDKSPFDGYQKVAVIEVQDFTIPKPDLTHDLHGDLDQVVVTGEVIELLEIGAFYEKYGEEITPDFHPSKDL